MAELREYAAQNSDDGRVRLRGWRVADARIRQSLVQMLHEEVGAALRMRARAVEGGARSGEGDDAPAAQEQPNVAIDTLLRAFIHAHVKPAELAEGVTCGQAESTARLGAIAHSDLCLLIAMEQSRDYGGLPATELGTWLRLVEPRP